MSGHIRISCVLYALLILFASAATPAHGQCNPQELAKLIASDATSTDDFGVSVAVSGDTAVVGSYAGDAPGVPNAGVAYVFVRSGGVWSQQAKLFAADGHGSDRFGVSVAVSGDTAVVGAYLHDFPGGTSSGAAFVFVRTGTTWTQQAKLFSTEMFTANDFFGISVAISGDTAVIGAYRDDLPGGVDHGSAFVFVRSGTAWSQQAKLTASDAAPSDSFGVSVAVVGDTAVVGAYEDDHAAAGSTEGSAYVFVRSGTVWTQQAKLVASDAANGDRLGRSVALSGETAVAGAYQDNDGGNDSGSAYVFVRSGTVWTQQAKLTASDAEAGDEFGFSVAVSGDTALVGAWDNPGADTDTGGAYAFVRSGTVWTQQPKLTASDAAANDDFGSAVGLSGDTAVVGAWLDDHLGGTDAGSAYIFDLGCAIVACCAGDFDASNLVSNADIPGFVADLIAGGICPALPACCPGDLGGDGLVDGRDIQGFVGKLFAGGACP